LAKAAEAERLAKVAEAERLASPAYFLDVFKAAEEKMKVANSKLSKLKQESERSTEELNNVDNSKQVKKRELEAKQ
jgi:hypothetical protein